MGQLWSGQLRSALVSSAQGSPLRLARSGQFRAAQISTAHVCSALSPFRLWSGRLGPGLSSGVGQLRSGQHRSSLVGTARVSPAQVSSTKVRTIRKARLRKLSVGQLIRSAQLRFALLLSGQLRLRASSGLVGVEKISSLQIRLGPLGQVSRGEL